MALRLILQKQKENPTAWHYLGLALEGEGKTNDARKAHETAAKLGYSLLKGLTGSGVSDYVESLRARSIDLYQAALGAKKVGFSKWKSDLLLDLAELTDPKNSISEKVYLGKEVSTKPRILRYPQPQFDSQRPASQRPARATLRAVFTWDGKVRAILPIESPGDSFIEECIRAAKTISFVPASKDGRPVSKYVELQYDFNMD